MDDLISREALKEAVRTLSGPQGIFVLTPAEILEAIEKAPSGVVRCEECKHWRESDVLLNPELNLCVRCLMNTRGDFFCAHGERKDNPRRIDA